MEQSCQHGGPAGSARGSHEADDHLKWRVKDAEMTRDTWRSGGLSERARWTSDDSERHQEMFSVLVSKSPMGLIVTSFCFVCVFLYFI